MKFLMGVNSLLSKIFVIINGKDIGENNFLVQVLLVISVFIVTIVLGIDTDTINNEKIYKKKYIIMVYSITILIFFNNNGRINIETLILSILLILFLNAIAGINTAYNLGLLEKELGVVNIFIYSFAGWFSKAKTYITIILLVILFLYNKHGSFFSKSNNIGLNYLDEIIMFIIIIGFFLFHIVQDIIDRFGYLGFEILKKELETTVELSGKSKDNLNKNKENKEFIEMLGLILYIEDKDFMKRKKPTYSFYLVVRRKIFDINLKGLIQKKKKNLITNINTRNTISAKIEYFIQYLFKGTRKVFKKLYRGFNIFVRNLFRNLFRGYSTLQQQIVRNAIMYPYSYNYLLRRKFFIENVYIKYFIKAYKKRIIKDKRIKRRWLNYVRNKRHLENAKYGKRKLIDYEIKIEMLIYYYKKILGEPKDMKELLNKLYLESAHSMEDLLNKENAYNDSKYKKYIINEILGRNNL